MSEPAAPEPAAPEPTPEGAAEVPWRQLHPASVVVNLIPQTWRVILSFWPFLLAIAVGRPDRQTETVFIDAFYVLLLFGSGAITTLVHYLTLRYRVRAGRLEIKKGLLNREARIIDPARIQNAERVQNVFHKAAGLVEVRLETAGDIRTEGLLSALTVADADLLMAELDALRGRAVRDEDAPAEAPIFTLGPLELIAHGLSAGRTGMASLLFFGVMEISAVVDPEGSEAAARTLNTPRLVALALLAISVAWVISAFVSLLRHHRFQLYREPDRLRSEWGLLTRRRVEIPLAKVQLARVEESPLRRLMGFGVLSVETAALGPVTDGPPPAELEVPLVERERLGEMIRLPFPGVYIDPWSIRLHHPHPRALWRAILASSLRWAPVVAAAGFIGGAKWGSLGGAFMLITVALIALDWQYQGWLVTDRIVIARRGFLRRRTWLVPQEKLQSVHLIDGPLLRLHRLGRLVLRVAGSQVVLPDLDDETARALMDRLRPQGAL